MAELRIDFDIDTYNSFVKEEITLEQFLNEVFRGNSNPMDEFDQGSEGEIIAQLLSYHSDEGGSPVCEDFFITDEVYNHDTKCGSAEVNYNVAYYFSCSDMNNDDDHHEHVEFEVDGDNEVLILSFMDYERRTTWEEF